MGHERHLALRGRSSQYLAGFAHNACDDFRRWTNVMHEPYGLASPNNKIIDISGAADQLARNRVPSNDIAFSPPEELQTDAG